MKDLELQNFKQSDIKEAVFKRCFGFVMGF